MVGKIITLNRVLALLAIAGILSGIYMLLLDRKPVPFSQPITPPAVPPFQSFVSGIGIVEAASENIEIGTIVGGVVDKVLVRKGDIVSKGDLLFTLDSRQAMADLKAKKAVLEGSEATLEEAKASLKSAQDLLALIDKVNDKRGVTKEELVTRQNNVLISQKKVESAQASIDTAQAQVDEAQTILNFYTIEAPLDCKIMQINVLPGEYASIIAPPSPLMLVGSVNRYHIRVNIDENDAWRFDPHESAIAFLRGNSQYHTNIKFEYTEPYVIPKRSFTGDSTERVDTRVLQVVYSYDPKDLPAYLGQEVDVYIQAAKIAGDVHYGGPLPVSR